MGDSEAGDLPWGACSYLRFNLHDFPRVGKAGVLEACKLALKPRD